MAYSHSYGLSRTFTWVVKGILPFTCIVKGILIFTWVGKDTEIYMVIYNILVLQIIVKLLQVSKLLSLNNNIRENLYKFCDYRATR